MSTERIGVYPGTFDPITNGHIDIILRATKIVDRLVVGVARNIGKGPLFSTDERVEMVQEEIAQFADEATRRRVEVKAYDILTMHFAVQEEASVIVRGLRAVSDFEYEFQMAGMNQQLNDDIETVFLMADVSLQPIASRLVKEIARFGGSIDKFVTPAVAQDVQRHLDSGSG